jgi:hypothetical protein
VVQLQTPVLDHWVGQQSITEQFQPAAGLRFIGGLYLHFHGFSDPQFAEAFHPKTFSGTTRGFSGWIEHRGAQTHKDAGLKTRHDQQLV